LIISNYSAIVVILEDIENNEKTNDKDTDNED